jgi:hypothetical protein
MRHADIDFKHLLPRQPSQAMPDLWEARLVRILCGVSTFYSQSFFPPLLNLRTIGGKHRSAFFSCLFSSGSHNTDKPPLENKERAGRRSVDGAQIPRNVTVLGASVFQASNQKV